eukprot:4244870-Prymnesium_polylepis.1
MEGGWGSPQHPELPAADPHARLPLRQARWMTPPSTTRSVRTRRTAATTSRLSSPRRRARRPAGASSSSPRR